MALHTFQTELTIVMAYCWVLGLTYFLVPYSDRDIVHQFLAQLRVACSEVCTSAVKTWPYKENPINPNTSSTTFIIYQPLTIALTLALIPDYVYPRYDVKPLTTTC
jgi:hypothetical protein